MDKKADFKVTTDLLSDYLVRFGFPKFTVKSEESEQQGYIGTGWKGDEGSFLAILDPSEVTGTMTFVVPEVIEIPADAEPQRLGEVYRYLLHDAMRMRIGSVGLDSRSNQVSMKISLGICDGDLTYEQFRYNFRALIALSETVRKNVKKILAGAADFDESGGELRDLGPPELSPELLAEFQKWLGQRSGGKPNGGTP